MEFRKSDTWVKATIATLAVLASMLPFAASARAITPLAYFGGEVQNNPHVYLTFWGKNWNNFSSDRSEIKEMFSHISGSAWQGILTQYYDSSGYISPNITFNSWTDESISAPNDVTDAHLEDEIEYATGQQGWPGAGMDNQYIVLPAPGSKYHEGFVEGCGAHRYSGRLNAPYSSAAWPEGAYIGCAEHYDPGQNRPWVGLARSIAHEYAETATDPVTVKYAGHKTAWIDAQNDDEIADKCYGQTPPGGSLANGSPVPKIWDNYQNQCSLSDPSPPQLKYTQTVIDQATSLNGNPGWATIKGHVSSPGLNVTGKVININFKKKEGASYVLKSTVQVPVTNGNYELANWNGVGVGEWVAKVVFPGQSPYAESSSNEATEGKFLVKDGYRLVNKASGKCVDVVGNSKDNNASIDQWDCGNPEVFQNQVFTMVPQGAYVQLVNRNSGRCLDVTGASTADGAPLQQYSCLGAGQANQLWQVVDVGGGYFELRAKHSNKCLDLPGASKTNGTALQQWSCNGLIQQKWEVQSVESAKIPTTTGLTVPEGERLYGSPWGFATAQGYVGTGAYGIGGNTLKVSYYKKNGAGSYVYQRAQNPTINSEGFYQVKYEGLAPGDWMIQSEFTGVGNLAGSKSAEVAFHIGVGYRFVFRHSSKCLTLNGNSAANGTAFLQWTCSPAPNSGDGQVFTMVPFTGGSYFELRVNSTGKCADVTAASTADGAWVQEWDCGGESAAHQLWQIVPIAGQEGWQAAIAKHSGKCMDVTGGTGATGDGPRIQQWTCSWAGNQQWAFQKIG